MRRAAIAGLALLALLAVLLWRSGSGRADRAPPRARASGAAPDAATDGSPVPGEPRGPAEAGREKRVEVRGTLLDEQGHALSEESGTLRLRVASETLAVPVLHGGWRASVPAGPRLHFEEIVLGGRRAIPLTPYLEIPGDGIVQVACRWFVPTRLRVLGEEREDLPDVHLVEGNIYTFEPARAHGFGPSPIVLPDDAGTRTYWVRARDHAWSQITVSLGRGGERAIRLPRGGAARVRIEDADPDAQVTLRVEALAIEPVGGEALIEGLPAGRCELVAEVASPEWTSPLSSVRTEVEVEAGTTREVTLSLHDAPLPKLLPLEGKLEVAAGWPDPRQSEDDGVPLIELFGPSGPTVVDVEDDSRWFAGDVPPGRYLLVIRPWTWVDVVDVGPTGNREARLVIPPPCEVEVHVVDAETGEPDAEADRVTWRVTSTRVDPELLRLAPWHDALCEEPGVCRFRAPVGTLLVTFWSDLRDRPEAEVVLKPGFNRVDLKTAPAFRFELAFRDGAIPVPVDMEFIHGIRVAPLRGDGRLDHLNIGDPCRVRVTKPGLYRVSPPAIEGYEPIAPLDVEVAGGTIPRIEVPLRRRER